MLDRADYTLADFLLFSARVYYRMFELHNAALWPLHILALIIGTFLVAVALKPSRLGARLAYVLLALIWLFVAWTFFLERYATINWAAVYVAPVFVLQAFLLGILAIRLKATELAYRGSIRGTLAVAVLLFSLVGYPLVAVALDRPWQAAEIFAIAPDPTATATLATLAIGRGTFVVLATVVPLLWIIVTSLTLYTLGSPEFVIAPLATLVCASAVIARN